MRAYLPTRIPLTKTLIFASILFVVQQFQHTGFVFSLLFFGFVLLSNIAFNAAGGFSRTAGAYVFFFSLLVVIVGVVWKAVVGEPADSNLLVPQLDMLCYTISMLMLLVVIFLSDRLFGRAKGIAPTETDYKLASIGCLVLGLTQMFVNAVVPASPGGLIAIVNQLSQFLPLAIILGTIDVIQETGGRRSMNFVNAIAMLMSFVSGMLVFSKQGMFIPAVCWLLGAFFAHLRLRVVHYVAIGLFAAFGLGIAPLVATGRDYAGANTYLQRAQVDYYILTHLPEAREQARETAQYEIDALGRIGYYNTSQGLIGRLSMISVDDSFFNYSNRGNFIGYGPIGTYYENWIPHVLLPDKPETIGGNYYAHEIGGFLAPDDNSTGVSFSPIPEAYHLGGWVGIFLLMPAIWFSLFLSMDLICGDFRRTPWGMLVVLIFAHSAPESLISGLVWLSGYGNLALLFAILFCTYFAPVVGALFYGAARHPSSSAAPRLYGHPSFGLPRSHS